MPQGSVLGPLLFLIYVNDLLKVISSPSLLFADDAKLFRPIPDYHSSQQLQNDILTLEQWSKLWQLNFNAKKSFIMKIMLAILITLVMTHFNLLKSVKILS